MRWAFHPRGSRVSGPLTGRRHLAFAARHIPRAQPRLWSLTSCFWQRAFELSDRQLVIADPIRLGSATRGLLSKRTENPGRHRPDIRCHQARLTKGEDHPAQCRTGLGLRENAPREGHASRETGCLRRQAGRAMRNDRSRSVQPQ